MTSSLRRAACAVLAGVGLASCGPASDATLSTTSTSPAVVVANDGNGLTVTTGALTFHYPYASGAWSLSAHGTSVIRGAYASVAVDGVGYLRSDAYASRSLTWQQSITDALGTGTQLFVDNVAPGKPTIRQQFTFYPGESFFTVDEIVWGGGTLSSSYMGAVIVSPPGAVTPGPGSDPRVLDVPFDNDEWVRYDSRKLGDTVFDGTGYEVAAVYENTDRHGVVVGSITHDFWKTGVYYECASGALDRLNVWGGVATHDKPSAGGPTYGKDGTHDAPTMAHGKMVASVLRSPRIFVGAYDDWRDGMERFGWANGQLKPPLRWNGGALFGWTSWAAYGGNATKMSAANLTTVSNALKTKLQAAGFANNGTAYVNIDAGFAGSASELASLVAAIHANGQKAGTYLSPFTLFDASANALSAPVPATSYTYGDIVLRDMAGTPIQHNSGWALDVTHPGTRTLITNQVDGVIAAGFDYLKLDFLTNGALEGRHHDASVATGVQAYNQAMSLIDGLLAPHPDIFVALSIAPLFPGGYGHSRRISCDAIGQVDDLMSPTFPHYGSTEYVMNGLTFGWWLSPNVYAYNDPDEMALNQWHLSGPSGQPYPAAWARAHVVAAAITGGLFLDSSDYSDAAALQRSLGYLGNAALDAVAAHGGPFRPVDGDVGYVRAPIAGATGQYNAGSQATELFAAPAGAAGGSTLVAVFNFDHSQAATRTISFARLGLSATATYQVDDLSTGANLGTAVGSMSVTTPAGDGVVYRLSPR